jgi:23S rRNA-/tRNA-specific pseudouridylate synthase
MPLVFDETPDLLFVRKRAGQPVFPWHRRPAWAKDDAPSVARQLEDERPEQALVEWPIGFECGIAHRVDVSTSGVIVAARRLDVLTEIRALFSERRLRKRYLFLTDREVPWDAHTERTPLAHHAKSKRKMIAQRNASTAKRGRWLEAITHFRRVGGGVWEARIPTGVTHQIRVHAQLVGLPVQGDTLYGGAALTDEWLAEHPGMSFCLHAAQIASDDWSSPTLPLPTWWPVED